MKQEVKAVTSQDDAYQNERLVIFKEEDEGGQINNQPKGCHKTHGGNLVKSQPICKIFHHWKKEISNKTRIHFPPHLNNVRTIPLPLGI